MRHRAEFHRGREFQQPRGRDETVPHRGSLLLPRVWTLVRSKLPSGLKLDRKTGLLAGTPRKPGRYPIRLRVADKLGVTNTRAFTITVNPS